MLAVLQNVGKFEWCSKQWKQETKEIRQRGLIFLFQYIFSPIYYHRIIIGVHGLLHVWKIHSHYKHLGFSLQPQTSREPHGVSSPIPHGGGKLTLKTPGGGEEDLQFWNARGPRGRGGGLRLSWGMDNPIIHAKNCLNVYWMDEAYIALHTFLNTYNPYQSMPIEPFLF